MVDSELHTGVNCQVVNRQVSGSRGNKKPRGVYHEVLGLHSILDYLSGIALRTRLAGYPKRTRDVQVHGDTRCDAITTGSHGRALHGPKGY